MIKQLSAFGLRLLYGFALATMVILLASSCAHSDRAQDTPEGARGLAGLDPELSNYSYPFPVKFFNFESQKQSLKMAYMDLMPTMSNGKTVVLLHGKNFSSAYWEPTARALAEHGYRVVMPDQIGFGKSTKPEFYQYSFAALARHTQALLQNLGVARAVVVGHSMGGMLAVRMTLMFPERTERLVLVNPIGLEDWSELVPYHSVDELYRNELQATPESLKDYERTNYFAGSWKPEYDRLLEIPVGWIQNPKYNLIAWNSALTTDMIFTQPVINDLPRLRAPTLFIIGQRDRTAIGKGWVSDQVAQKLGDYPTLGRRAARAVPGARIAELQNVGHLPQIEAFNTYIEALLVFLNERTQKIR